MQRQTHNRRCPGAVYWMLCSAIAAAAFGCSKNTPSEVKRRYAGIALRIACPDPTVWTGLSGGAAAWAASTGARVEFVSEADANDLGGDICIVRAAQLPQFAAANRLHPVPGDYTRADAAYAWLDIVPACRNKLLAWAGTTYGMPLVGDAPICYYRDDWLKDAKHQAAFAERHRRPLAPPTTWDEFADVAEYFASNQTGGTRHSLAPPASADDELCREFYGVAAPLARRAIREDDKNPPGDTELFSFAYDVLNGSPRINQPAFVAALRMMQRLQANRVTTASIHPEEAFRAGHAALCVSGSRWLARFQDDKSAVRGRFGICRVPGSRRVYDFKPPDSKTTDEPNYVPYLGSGVWLGVVPSGSPNAAAAFELLAELSGPQTSGEIVLANAVAGGPFRRSHFLLLSKGNTFELEAGQNLAFVEAIRQAWLPSLVNPVICLRIPEAAAHERELAKGIRAALERSEADAAAILEAVAHRWIEIDARENPTARILNYRLSLGLGRTP